MVLKVEVRIPLRGQLPSGLSSPTNLYVLPFSGSGKGGTSIWGRKFEDEYSEYLKVCILCLVVSCNNFIYFEELVWTLGHMCNLGCNPNQ